MIILTGANRDKPTDDSGNIRHDIEFTFGSVINRTVKKAEELGYKAEVYDLGTLGFGRPFNVGDESFSKLGYYEKEVVKGYKSKSLFKPKMVMSCIEEHKDITVYLDGDALLCESLAGIETDDYDVGVTLRHPVELEGDWYEEHIEIAKYVNAGVIIFRPTPATDKFLAEWDVLTDDIGNDQMALNKLTCPGDYPEVGSVSVVNGVRVKYFSGAEYNYYYFKELKSTGVKIMHFKGTVRDLYPLSWKTKLSLNLMIVVRNFLKFLKLKS